MLEDPCPNCGHRRKLSPMSIRRDSPGLKALWRGDRGPVWRIFVQVAVTANVVLAIVAAIMMLHG